MNLSHQTSRQPVHLYNELPLGCLHLVLVFNHCLWKDGNNLICPALLQLILWVRASLLLHVGDSYSESFLNVRPKGDPASLNWICRPPLTSFIFQILTSSWPTHKLAGLEAWEQGLCLFAYAVCAQGGFELGSCETILEEEGREKAMVGVRGMWQLSQLFPFPLLQRLNYIGKQLWALGCF